jgi:hypothetical protein
MTNKYRTPKAMTIMDVPYGKIKTIKKKYMKHPL